MGARLLSLISPAAVALSVALGVALCAAPADGYRNGQLPRHVLVPAAQGGCVKLARGPAAAWNTLQLGLRRRLPVSGCDSAYRPLARQWFWRRVWCMKGRCGNAARPGTSNHGWGLAVDVPWRVRRLVDRHGARFGWAKRWSDAQHEWWHLKWRAGVWRVRPDPGINIRDPLLAEGSGGPGQAFSVRRLQGHLRRHRTCPRLRRDGHYGRTTTRCVIRFQAGHRLAGDGRVGRATWKALRRPARRRVSDSRGR